MASLQLVEHRKKSYKVGLYLEEASQQRVDHLMEVRQFKREETLLNKRGGGEELLLLQSEQLFSDASQTHDNDTMEMYPSKVGLYLGEDSRRREEIMHSKGTENLLNKRGGGEEPILRSKQLFSDASQTSDVDTLEMAVSKAGFEAIIDLSLRHTEYKDEAAAALAISKALSEGSDEQIRMFMQRGCVGKLCESLKSPDPKIVVCCLEGLRKILKVGRADKRAGKNSRGKSIYAEMIDDRGGFDLMEDLLIHSNPKVTDWFEAFKKAVVILSVYSCSDVPDSVEDSDEFVCKVIHLPPEFESDPFDINLHLNESSPPEVDPWFSFTIA